MRRVSSSLSLSIAARAAGLACLAIFATPRASAVDFIRGDANGDGAVTISDAAFIGHFLYLGQAAPACHKAADVDDSGGINLTDAVLIYMIAERGEELIRAPYPIAGEDPTPDELSCDSYGGGTMVEDPGARIRVAVDPAPGGAEYHATVRVHVSNTREIAGLAGKLRIDSAVIYSAGKATLDPGRSTIALGVAHVAEGELDFAMISSLTSPDPIPPGVDVEVMSFDLCLRTGAGAGTYPTTFIAGELIDEATAQAISPGLESESLVIVSDLDDKAGCTDFGPGNPPVAPEDVQAAFRLGATVAAPGSSVVVPYSVESNADVQAFSISVDFDEDVVEAIGVERLFRKPDRTDWGFYSALFDNTRASAGSGGVDEGWVVAVGVMSFDDNLNNIPANRVNEVLGLRFQVRDDAPSGPTAVRFVDGAQPFSQPIRNSMTSFGTTVDPSVAKAFILVNAFMNVVADITLFIRGDSNGDGAVDISDAQTTLGYLYLGERAPNCFDAADANDDGQLNIADPVAVLQHLFLGSGPLPPPNEVEGSDPTPDRLGCQFLR